MAPHPHHENDQPIYTSGLMYGGVLERPKGGIYGGLDSTALNAFTEWAKSRGVDAPNPNTIHPEISDTLTAGQAYSQYLGSRAIFSSGPNINEPWTFEDHTRHGDVPEQDVSAASGVKPSVHRLLPREELSPGYNRDMNESYAPPSFDDLLAQSQRSPNPNSLGFFLAESPSGRPVRYIPGDDLARFAIRHESSVETLSPKDIDDHIGQALIGLTENLSPTATSIIVSPAELLRGCSWEIAYDTLMNRTGHVRGRHGALDIITNPRLDSLVREMLDDPSIEIGPQKLLPDMSTFTRQEEGALVFSHNHSFTEHNSRYKRHAQAFWARRPNLTALMHEIRPEEAKRDPYDQGVIDVVDHIFQQNQHTIIVEAAEDEIAWRRPWLDEIIKAFKNESWRVNGRQYDPGANSRLVLRTTEGQIKDTFTLDRPASRQQAA